MNTHPLHPETNPVMALADGEQASLPVGDGEVAALDRPAGDVLGDDITVGLHPVHAGEDPGAGQVPLHRDARVLDHPLDLGIGGALEAETGDDVALDAHRQADE